MKLVPLVVVISIMRWQGEGEADNDNEEDKEDDKEKESWRHDDDDDKVDHEDDSEGVHPNSHKHFIPYMGFCASIWDSVRHHCHPPPHHHHDHLKWTVKQQRRRPKNLWANFKRLGWMDISILRHGPALDGRQTWQTTARKPTMASSTGR